MNRLVDNTAPISLIGGQGVKNSPFGG